MSVSGLTDVCYSIDKKQPSHNFLLDSNREHEQLNEIDQIVFRDNDHSGDGYGKKVEYSSLLLLKGRREKELAPLQFKRKNKKTPTTVSSITQ